MSVLPYLVAGWLFLLGCYGMVTSCNLVHTVACLTVTQSATYVLLLTVGFRAGASAPVFGDIPVGTRVVDPVVQALTLTDIVVSAMVTAVLLALTIQIHKRHGTVNPDELRALRN